METATDAFNVVSAVQCGACPMPSFALDPSGLIEVSWSGDGIKIEIEVDGSGDAEVFQRCPGFAEVDRPVTIASGDFRFVAAALTRISK